MVRFALNSIKKQSYKNWELIFVDDSSIVPGEPIVREILSDDLDKIKFYNTNDPDKKEGNGESVFGKYWNNGSLESNSDISIMLCDDDALMPNYLEKLVQWYKDNPNKNYSYCHLNIFDPYTIKSLDDIGLNTDYILNHTSDIHPYSMLDSSQVSWKTDAIRTHGVRFPSPKTSSLDAILYSQLASIYGLCPFNGIIGQCKGVHSDQLNVKEGKYLKGEVSSDKMYNIEDVTFLPS